MMVLAGIEKRALKSAQSLRETQLIMGMPITVELVGHRPDREAMLADTFAHFTAIDEQFSTYKGTSEISRFNRGECTEAELSPDLRKIFALGETTRLETRGFFDMRRPDGLIDPSGIVKGWAIRNAAEALRARGFDNFYVEAGGDIQTAGIDARGLPWAIGIRSPFAVHEIVKVLFPRGKGVATSGTSIRGQHIYDPHAPSMPLTEVVSLTVIGPDILEADRFATAAFAMGSAGIGFIERLDGFEGYEIQANGMARATTGFAQLTATE